MSRPPYGSHSGSRHACQKRPTSQCGWTRRAAAQTVVAQRVLGGARKALLRDRGNESLRRRLSEGAPSRGAHAGDGFIVGGSSSRADARLGSALLVVKSGGKEVSHIEKNSDVTSMYGLSAAWHWTLSSKPTSRRARAEASSSECHTVTLSAVEARLDRGEESGDGLGLDLEIDPLVGALGGPARDGVRGSGGSGGGSGVWNH